MQVCCPGVHEDDGFAERSTSRRIVPQKCRGWLVGTDAARI